MCSFQREGEEGERMIRCCPREISAAGHGSRDQSTHPQALKRCSCMAAPVSSRTERLGDAAPISAELRQKFQKQLVGGPGPAKPLSASIVPPAVPPTTALPPGAFFLHVGGQIELAEFPGESMLFCTYEFTHGPDWTFVQGQDHGVSQMCVPTPGGDMPTFVWNLPLDVTLKSTNPFGWPRIVITVVSRDIFRRIVVRGYGSVAVPTIAGHTVKLVRTFAPLTSSIFQQISAYFKGTAPQFYDTTFPAKGEGREATRVRSSGIVRVSFDVVTRGMASHGYIASAPKS